MIAFRRVPSRPEQRTMGSFVPDLGVARMAGRFRPSVRFVKIFLSEPPGNRSNIRRFELLRQGRSVASCFPPCSWRIHGESSPRKFSHRQHPVSRTPSRRSSRLGSDRLCGFRLGFVWRVGLLRFGLRYTVVEALFSAGLPGGPGPSRRLRTSSHRCAGFRPSIPYL